MYTDTDSIKKKQELNALYGKSVTNPSRFDLLIKHITEWKDDNKRPIIAKVIKDGMLIGYVVTIDESGMNLIGDGFQLLAEYDSCPISSLSIIGEL